MMIIIVIIIIINHSPLYIYIYSFATMISIITAAEKQKELQSSTVEVKEYLALAAKEAKGVPFHVNPYPIGHILFGCSVDFPAVSKWLQDAGWCLAIEYRDTGNNAEVSNITMGYYASRGWSNENAIKQLCVSPMSVDPTFF